MTQDGGPERCSCSLDGDRPVRFPQGEMGSGSYIDYHLEWDHHTRFAVMSRFAIKAARRASVSDVQAMTPAELVFRWRR